MDELIVLAHLKKLCIWTDYMPMPAFNEVAPSGHNQ